MTHRKHLVTGLALVLASAKREAQSRIVDVLLDRSRASAKKAAAGTAREPTYREYITLFRPSL
jgi:hypothetical protein